MRREYGNSRNFALYDGEALFGVFVYKKGAEAIRHKLEQDETVIAETTQIIAEMTHALAERPVPPCSYPGTTDAGDDAEARAAQLPGSCRAPPSAAADVASCR